MTNPTLSDLLEWPEHALLELAAETADRIEDLRRDYRAANADVRALDFTAKNVSRLHTANALLEELRAEQKLAANIERAYKMQNH